MAVEFEGFSIREYALKMRTVNYGKCWPFGDGVEGRRLLPDLPVRKFRWWADELKPMRDDSETPEPAIAGFDSEKKRPVLAAAKLPAINGDEYGASVATENSKPAKVCSPSRMKQRTPKKRSIVELFAVSPPMKAVKIKTSPSGEGSKDQKGGDEEERENEEEEESLIGEVLSERKPSKGRKKRLEDNALKYSKNKIGIKKKIMKKKKKKKKKKKRIIMKKDEKDKTCKLSKVNKRLHNAEYSSMRTLLLSQIKNARARNSNAEHILRLSSKLTSKSREASMSRPANNILKKQKRRISDKKGKTKIVITEFSCEPNKQLSSAGNDGKAGQKEKFKKMGLPNLRRLCKIISDVLAASSTPDDSGEPICATEADQLVNFHDKEVITRNVESGEASTEGNQVNDTIVGMSSGGTKKTHFSQSLDLNYPAQNYVDLTRFSFDNSSCTPSSEIYESNQKVPDLMNKAVASVGCENLAEPSASFMPDFGKRIENASAKCSFVSFPSSSSLGERRVSLDLPSCWTGKSIKEGFVGLPLNSQGALIQMHPNTRLDFGDRHMRSIPAPDCLSLLSPSYHIEPHTEEEQGEYIQLYKEDPQNWFSKQYFPDGNVLTSDIGSSELHGLGKFTHDAHTQFTDRDFRKMGTSYNGRKNGSFHENCFDKYFHPSLQRSMRLMGKNVIIGRVSKDSKEYYDGNVWKDKGIINQNAPTMNAYNGHNMNRYPQEECIMHPHFVLSRDSLSSPLEAQSMCTSVPSTGKTSEYIHFNIVPQRMSNDRNYSATKYQGLHTGTSSGYVPLQNYPNDFTFECNSASSFIDLGQPKSVWASYPGYSKQSSFNQPLLDQVSWSYGQAGTAHSSQRVPHWLLNPINQHPVISNCPVNVQPPCGVPSNICFPAAPPRRPVMVFPCNGNRILQTCGFSAPTSSVYNSSLAAMASSSFSSINPGENNRAGNKAVELNFSHVNMQEHYRNSRKRPLVHNDIVKRTVKRPAFTDPARSSIMQPSHPLMQKDKHGTAASSETYAFTANCERPGMTVNAGIKHKDSLESSSGLCPTNSYAQTTSGPVKLSAGAKHILRPSQIMDRENARPIHSKIPFVQRTSIDDGSPMQTATKVYRF